MADALLTVNKLKTPQSQKARKDQVKNNAGGFVFKADLESRFLRFLILGVEGNTYYQGVQELAKSNAKVAFDFAKSNPRRMAEVLREVSVSGRAPKQNATLFSLAVLMTECPDHGSLIFNEVVRTGTHLFTFLNYVQNMRGWGRSLRTTVADWYLYKSADKVAFQSVKYRQRNGWTHRDVLRKAHPVTFDVKRDSVFKWITQGTESDLLPDVIKGYLKVNEKEYTEDQYAELVQKYKLTWEMLPDGARKYVKVWEAILENGFPMTALIRQLPTLTRIGFFKDKKNVARVVAQLQDTEELHKSKIHPISVLLAMKTYSNGKSHNGSSSWVPVTKIVDALDDAFYASFDNVEATGKRTLIALDISGSMGYHSDSTGILTAREVSAAMSLVTLKAETDVDVVGFSGNIFSSSQASELINLNISAKQRLDDIVKNISNLPFGPTDCALPMEYARKNELEYDTFIILTDNETWSGNIQPMQALKQYRKALGIDAKLVVAAVTPTKFTIADPEDQGSLDICGFDSAVPQLIADFSKGEI